jgi:hypothetical protein
MSNKYTKEEVMAHEWGQSAARHVGRDLNNGEIKRIGAAIERGGINCHLDFHSGSTDDEMERAIKHLDIGALLTDPDPSQEIDSIALFDTGASRESKCECIVRSIILREEVNDLTCIHMAKKALAGSDRINALNENYLDEFNGTEDESERTRIFNEYKGKIDAAKMEIDPNVYGMSAAVSFLRPELDKLRTVNPDIVMAVEWLHYRSKTFKSAQSSEEMMYPSGIGYTNEELDEFFRG